MRLVPLFRRLHHLLHGFIQLFLLQPRNDIYRDHNRRHKENDLYKRLNPYRNSHALYLFPRLCRIKFHCAAFAFSASAVFFGEAISGGQDEIRTHNACSTMQNGFRDRPVSPAPAPVRIPGNRRALRKPRYFTALSYSDRFFRCSSGRSHAGSSPGFQMPTSAYRKRFRLSSALLCTSDSPREERSHNGQG